MSPPLKEISYGQTEPFLSPPCVGGQAIIPHVLTVFCIQATAQKTGLAGYPAGLAVGSLFQFKGKGLGSCIRLHLSSTQAHCENVFEIIF